MTTGRTAGLITLLMAAVLGGCKPDNKFVAPPLSEVSVAPPLQQNVRPFLELTGNTVAFNTVDLVARVQGFLQAIDYKDGDFVKQGAPLFRIDPTIYDALAKQADAELASAKANLVVTQADFERQETLLRQNVTAQVGLDQARAKRDSAAANVENNTANLTIAQTNLGYTTVTAPFDGIVTNHLVSAGELVGSGTPTKLATIIQLDPIYVTFTMSEQQVLDLRAKLSQGDRSAEWFKQVPVGIGLMTEQGFPHRGRLDYASPTIDTTTGTILIRALFENSDRALLPGLFVRIHLPTDRTEKPSQVIPERLVTQDQSGWYVLVIGKDDMVEQRRVTLGPLLTGGMRVIDSGLKANDRVVVDTNGRAIPGRKVLPKATTIAAPANSQ
jgi:RND family efflux transporter MFP subunit